MDVLVGFNILLLFIIIILAYTSININSNMSTYNNKQNFITIDDIEDSSRCYNITEFGCTGTEGIFYKLEDGKCINAVKITPIINSPGEFTYKIVLPSDLVNICYNNVVYPSEGRYIRLLINTPIVFKRFFAYHNSNVLPTNSVFTDIPLMYSQGYLDVLKDRYNEQPVYIPDPATYIQIDVMKNWSNSIITDIVIELSEYDDYMYQINNMTLQILYDPYLPGSLGPPQHLPGINEDWNVIVVFEKKINEMIII